jgi:hypothetical protein
MNYFILCHKLYFSVKVAAITHSSVEQDLFQLATHASGCLDRLYPSGRLAEVRSTNLPTFLFYWVSHKQLHNTFDLTKATNIWSKND